VALVDLPHASLQLLADGPRSKDQQLIDCGHAARDPLHESLKMLQPVGFSGGLRPAAAAAMADHGVVPDMPRRMTVGGHVRRDALDPGRAVTPADDDRLLGVNPYDAHRPGAHVADRRCR
jgi:hypothetical protein